MREERGTIPGDVVVYEPFTLWGSVGGKVTVVDGGKFWLRGSVYGDLIVEDGGRVHVMGSVIGTVTLKDGAKVIVSGTIGSAVNNGGRLYVERTGKVMGSVKTRAGETKFKEPR